MTGIYEIRDEHGDHYHCLGMFAHLSEGLNAIKGHDGPDTHGGGQVSEYGDGGEGLRIVRHSIGLLCEDDQSVLVAVIKREVTLPDEDEIADGISEDAYIWRSEVRIVEQEAAR